MRKRPQPGGTHGRRRLEQALTNERGGPLPAKWQRDAPIFGQGVPRRKDGVNTRNPDRRASEGWEATTAMQQIQYASTLRQHGNNITLSDGGNRNLQDIPPSDNVHFAVLPGAPNRNQLQIQSRRGRDYHAMLPICRQAVWQRACPDTT